MCLLCRETYEARVPRLQRRLDARRDPDRDNPRRCALRCTPRGPTERVKGCSRDLTRMTDRCVLLESIGIRKIVGERSGPPGCLSLSADRRERANVITEEPWQLQPLRSFNVHGGEEARVKSPRRWMTL